MTFGRLNQMLWSGKVGKDYIIADSRFWETRDYNGHLV